MSLDRQVFLSLLALDAYNRGPGAGITGLGVPDLDAQGNPTQTIRIGRAQVISGSEAILGPASLVAGFSAVAYSLDGETIISYRGTNFPGGNKSLGQNALELNDFLRDFFGGWSLFTGFTRPVQVDFARAFYEEVTEESFRGEAGFSQPSNITLTGHSLGGALAGYVGSRSDADAFVFDPIPFGEVATADAFRDAFLKTIRDLDLSDVTAVLADILVGPIDPFDLIPDSDFTVEDFVAEFARNVAASVPDFTKVSGRFLEGEIAAQIPTLQTIIGIRLAEFGTTITPFATLLGTQLVALGIDQAQQGLVNASTGDRDRVTVTLNRGLPDETILAGSGDSIDLHSQTTLTLMLFGERQWSPSTESGGEGGGSDWERAIRFVIPSITSEEIAAGLGLDGDTGAAPAGSQLANTITYSILNEGQLVFGDAGARALFDDARDLGFFIEFAPGPDILGEAALFDIGAVVAEFAGLLATRRVERESDRDVTDGILRSQEAAGFLEVDVSGETWSRFLDGEEYTTTQGAELISSVIESRLSAVASDATGDSSFVNSFLRQWSTAPRLFGSPDSSSDAFFDNPLVPPGATVSAGLIDRIIFGDDVNVPLSAFEREGSAAEFDGFQLIVGGDPTQGQNNIGGSLLPPTKSIVISGNGGNVIDGSDEDDAIITGSGNDHLTGQDGNDFFFAGSGTNTIDGGDGNDTAVYQDDIALRVSYSGNIAEGSLTVLGFGLQDTLTNVERVIAGSRNARFDITGYIAADTELRISAPSASGNVPSRQLIFGQDARAGLNINLNSVGGSSLRDLETDGIIRFDNFNTTVFGSDFNDTISDFSDEEKIISGGGGDDTISIAETLPDSVLIGGAGADRIIGGHGDDVLIDQQFGVGEGVSLSQSSGGSGDDVRAQGTIAAGFGDDEVVVDIQGISDRQFGTSEYTYAIDAGEGNDRVQLNFNGTVLYRYERGDGGDIIRQDTNLQFVENTTNDDFPAFDPTTFSGANYSFDISGYAPEEIKFTFAIKEATRTFVDQPTGSVPDGSEHILRGDLLIEFADGGFIFAEDYYRTVFGFTGPDFVENLDNVDDVFLPGFGTVSSFTQFRGSIAPPAAPPSPEPPAPDPMENENGGPAPDPAQNPTGESSPNENGGLAPQTAQTLSTPGIAASAQNATGGDQEVRLERGVASYIGGAGLDRLIVEWTLDTLVVTGDASNITISDRWGVLGTTTLTDFDEIQVFETDTIYTVQGFLDAVEARQFAAPISGTEEDDALLGTEIRDRINGLDGNDTIDGLAGDDILTGGAGDDIIDGSDGDDELFGNEGQDTLRGGDGDDLLDGGADADTLEGGLGDDTYVVDSASDTITEAADAGIDRVEAAIDYTLSDNIEELTLTGSAMSGTGNVGDNRIAGNDENNTLSGLGGDDILLGRDGDDTLEGGEGADVLQGNDGVDVLFGGSGNDRLDGGADNDELIGGLGDDTYIIDGSGDQVIEAAGEGFDTVISNAISYTADASIEEVVLGDEALDANASDEGIIIRGNALNNAISGGEGEDEIYGGEGDDFLTGSDGGGTSLPPGGGTPLTPFTGIGIGIGDPPPDPEPAADGNDRIFGEEGNDVIFGGLGDDDLYGGSGNDEIHGEDGRDKIFGGLGFDLIFAQSDGDLIVGEGEASREDVGQFVSAPGWSAESGQTDVASYSGARSDFEISDLGNGWFEVQSLLPDAGEADLLVRIGEIEFNSDAGAELFSLTPPEAALGFEQIELTQGDSFAVTLDSSWFVDPNGETFQFTLAQANGSVPPAWISLDNGQITGTSPTDFDGTISLVITATSSTGSASRTLEIAVATDNEAPQLDQGLVDVIVAEDTAIEFEVPSDAFSDPDGDSLALSATLSDGSPLPDWLSFDGIAFTGTPPQDFNGALELTVTASDGSLEVADRFVLTIDPVADAPQAVADSFSTGEDTALQITAAELIGNDSDVDSTALNLVAVQNAVGGVVSLLDGVVTFTPNTDFFGTASFEYLLTDGDTDPVVGSVSVDVTPVNDAVLTGSDSFDTDEDVAINLAPSAFLANDIDPEGGAVSITSVTALTDDASAVIEADGSITLTPPADAFGLIRFEYTVADDTGLESTGQVSLFATSINDAPILVNALADQSSPEEASFSFAIDAATFSDVDDSMLSLSANLGDGSPLPEWLAFDGANLTGTPPQHFNDSLEVTVTASDGEFSASDTFTLTIDPVNDAPMLLQVVPDVASPEDTVISFGIPADSFVDVDGDALTLSAALDDGSALPSWLSFDGETFTGTPPQDFNGSLALTVTASDGELSASDMFVLTIDPVNDAPVLVQSLTDVSSPEDSAISIDIPTDAFTDVDGDALILSATLSDGSELPAWLAFDGGSFTGTPPQDFNGALNLLVTASDGELTADAAFTLTIDPVNDAPVLVQALADVFSDEDISLSVALPADAFADVDGDALTLSATLSDGSALPDWLSFDGATFSGTPPQDFNGSFDLTVTANDGEFTTADNFTLTIDPVNDAPTLVQATADLQANVGDALSINFTNGVFADVDGDVLTFSASLPDGSALPSWLTFTGGVLASDNVPAEVGDFEITVSASDGQASVSDAFVLTVLGGNTAPEAVDDGVFVTTANRTLAIDPNTLLENDIDAEGDTLTLVSVQDASIGEVSVDADGNIIYIPDAVYTGGASFTYTVSDGEFTSTATVSINIDPSDAFDGFREGNDNNNRLFGSLFGRNRIFGAGGNDLIVGGFASDELAGGDGNDRIYGLWGDDDLYGGQGDDDLYGGFGFDTAHLLGDIEDYQIFTSGGFFNVTQTVDTNTSVDGNDGVDLLVSVERLQFKGGDTLNIASPIILDLAGDGVQTVSADDSNALFDLDGDGLADNTSWIGANDAFLFLDRDGNGVVSGIQEISFIDDIEDAASDLEGLAAFDSNGDGILTADDERFDEFGVWNDADGDGAVDDGETANLREVAIESLNLDGTPVEGMTRFGEVAIANTGSFTLANGTTREFADAGLTYFSASTNLPELSTTHYDFDRKAKKYRIHISGGVAAVDRKRRRASVNSLAGQLGANTIISTKKGDYGRFAPVVLDLDGDGIEMVRMKRSNARFDYGGDGRSDATGWLSGDDGFLVIDRNNDGLITEASELTLASEDENARTGLQGLANMDSNGDGVVDADDARFGELRVWQDRNANGRTDAGELMTLEEAGIVSVSLAATGLEDRVKLDRNAVTATASLTRSNGTTSTVADVSLAYRPANAPTASTTFDPGFAFGSDLFLQNAGAPQIPREFPALDAFFDQLRGDFAGSSTELFDRFTRSPSQAFSQPQSEPNTAFDRSRFGFVQTPSQQTAQAQTTQALPNERVTLAALNDDGPGEAFFQTDAALERWATDRQTILQDGVASTGQRNVTAPSEPEALLNPEADLARKLMMIRQEMGAFGGSNSVETDRLHPNTQDHLYFYA